MVEFSGSKFRPTNEVKVYYDEFGNKREKTVFVPTSSYMKYLEEKRQLEKEKEIKTLKENLEYQYKTYGVVDEIEFNYYLYLIKNTTK